MFNTLGYKKNLFILPFDHRSSFAKLFGFTNPELSSDEKNIITSAKETIFMAFEKALLKGVPKELGAILIDEEYGDKIIRDAIGKKYNVILTTEKSGQKEFTFEYGDEFGKHIEKYKPTFVKALVHYNPNDDPLSKMRQQQKLEVLSNYCHQNSYKFLFEILVPPTESQLRNVSGNIQRYDTEVRPNLTAKAIEELQNVNVKPDIWKIEGMEEEDSYKIVSLQVQKGGDNVGIVILGRAENQDKVEQWIKAGNKIKGVVGFAVGRTVFWEPLTQYKNGTIDRDTTIEQISNNFLHFYNIFTNKE
ncbi:MAG: DUF2090 domain-containing protein [Candidatus Levybacteria bacterium]|nr:DUF2090 domain-containing protein [Candidatus Levybacteria bacterium]